MPRWGKSTGIQIAEMETSVYQIPLRVEVEEPIGERPKDLRWDDNDAMTYNFSYALSGLSRLIRNYSTQDPQICIYERGSVDHLVFAEALNKLYYRDSPRYAEVIGAFKTFFGFYLDRVDGIIICNSTPDTAIKRGSTLPKDLLDLLSQGYKNFPKTLSEIIIGGRIDPIVTLNLNFEELENPVHKLTEAIYTMINWSLEGEVTAYPLRKV
jgi:hypothetical protein